VPIGPVPIGPVLIGPVLIGIVAQKVVSVILLEAKVHVVSCYCHFKFCHANSKNYAHISNNSHYKAFGTDLKACVRENQLDW